MSKVYAVSKIDLYSKKHGIIAGKKYEVVSTHVNMLFVIHCEDGQQLICRWENCAHQMHHGEYSWEKVVEESDEGGVK